MSEAEQLQRVLSGLMAERQRVRSIKYVVDQDLPRRPVAIGFELEGSSFCVAVNGIDDTVQIATTWPDEYRSLPVSEVNRGKSPWLRVVGSQLSGAWMLTNQQGYQDGVQLEFRGAENGEVVCIQLLAMASTLELRIVTICG